LLGLFPDVDDGLGRVDENIPTGNKAFAGSVIDNDVNTAALVVAIADRRSNEMPPSLVFAADSADEVLRK